MKPIWILLAILAEFGIVGRIDYEAELSCAELRSEYARKFTAHRAGERP